MTGQASLWLLPQPLLLASASAFRRALLQSIAIPVDQLAASVDERVIEAQLAQQGASPPDVAVELARSKALAVSVLQPDRLVLGCDQTLALGQEALHKPDGIAGARRHLQKLSGRTHSLHSGFALARWGAVISAEIETAHMTMRALSDNMIDQYLSAAGEAILKSVGAYQIEGLGQHLFERIEGDQSTIVGLPILPLLRALRAIGAVAA